MLKQVLLTFLLCLLFVTGCASGPSQQRGVGILDYYQENSAGVLTVPATVQAGQAFPITISTFGGGCDRRGGADVNITGLVATVNVYDFFQVSGACTAQLVRFPREVRLRFNTPGTAQIEVRGRRLGLETTTGGKPTILTATVTVK